MKVKHILALFLITFIIMTIGTLFKIMHWPYGNEFIILATIIKVIVGILAIWKLFTMQGFKDFLNK
ncbi:gliding motility protein GldL [Dokdonia ponticola]|uniref:Gliding motility protein GldL n=1 Tax=Dokdonia ponticola TaxID=2041041 RepID=A0ABV9HXD0_9FLAO